MSLCRADKKAHFVPLHLGNRGGDFGRGLSREFELELVKEEAKFWGRLGVASEDESAIVVCGDVDINHLDFGKFFDDGTGGETRGRGTGNLWKEVASGNGASG